MRTRQGQGAGVSITDTVHAMLQKVRGCAQRKTTYFLAEQLNTSNDTYARQDLFDTLYKMRILKKDGKSGKEIAELIGWAQSNVSQHNTLLEKIFTPILDLCKQHQEGRVNLEFTPVTFNFTEGWFRTSGLYDLTEEFQLAFFERFKEDKFNWNKSKVQDETGKDTAISRPMSAQSWHCC